LFARRRATKTVERDRRRDLAVRATVMTPRQVAVGEQLHDAYSKMKHTPLMTTPGHGLSPGGGGATVVVVVDAVVDVVVDVVVDAVVFGVHSRGARRCRQWWPRATCCRCGARHVTACFARGDAPDSLASMASIALTATATTSAAVRRLPRRRMSTPFGLPLHCE
jgi:hypothetical protein